jgi:nitrite transporter NirC
VLAGAYLGFAITLIFSVGAPFAAAGSPAFKLVMGAAFGVVLALVIFAGSELFTGNNMVCMIGALTRVISWGTWLGSSVCRSSGTWRARYGWRG